MCSRALRCIANAQSHSIASNSRYADPSKDLCVIHHISAQHSPPPYYFPSHFKNIVAADSYLFKDRIQRERVKYLYNIVGSLCEPGARPARSEDIAEQMPLRVSSVDELGTSLTDAPYFSEGRMLHILRSKIRIRKSHNVSASMSPVMQMRTSH